ncbi:MAG: tyrosine/phenylalanine carboxypeptidase domain-containing protein [Candidatus Peribacteraceae bacterium]
MKLFIPPFFRDHGVLGINARNLLYIKPHNDRSTVAFADNKLKTKAFLSARGIPTAKTFAHIESRRQLSTFDFSTLPAECVLKPNNGFGGEGIIILRGRKNGRFLVQGRTPISDEELTEHIEDILDGKFAINNQTDTAFFEQILTPHKCFVPLRPAGLPDIRIIVFNLVPVMAMLRIPTAESQGKANVHLGGVGIGIDMGSGTTTFGTQYNHSVTELAHGASVRGLELPYWDQMLEIAAKIQHVTGIGYLAVDLTIDADKGPVLLEVNARAGLMVQIANMAPLKARLKRVQGLKVQKPEKGVALAKELFGESAHRTKVAARPILGPSELVTIAGSDFTLTEPAAIEPQQEDSAFAPELLAELVSRSAAEAIEGAEKLFRVKMTLADQKIVSHVRSRPIKGDYRISIGRHDLQGFLIDPMKKGSVRAEQKSILKKDLRGADRILAGIDRDLPLLKYVKPANLRDELVKIRRDASYEPLFQQRTIDIDLQEAERMLQEIETDLSPLGVLLEAKKRELLCRIELLRARGDAERFTKASIQLYGEATPDLVRDATQYLESRQACLLPSAEEKDLSAEQTVEFFEEVLKKYGLHEWNVSIKPSMITDCAVGGRKIFIKEGATFSPVHVQSLIAHEIETHVLTAENGATQPYAIFTRGTAGYLDTQEGLAVWNQSKVLPPHHEKMYAHAKNILGISFAASHSFAETRKYLQAELGMRPEKAISKAIDYKRGLANASDHGGFTKSLVYFRGWQKIREFVLRGGEIRDLYLGKMAVEDLGVIQSMPELKKPLLLPLSLRETSKQQKKVPQKRTKKV